MQITLPISSLLIIAIGSIGVIISICLSSILFFKDDRKDISNKILAVFLLGAGLTLLNEILTTSGITNRIQALYFIPINYSLSLAPLFYLFIKSKYHQSVTKFDSIHLVFPVIQAITYLSIGFQSVAFKGELWANSSFRFYLLAEQVLFLIMLVVYSYLSTKILKTPTTEKYFWSVDLKQWLVSMTKSIVVLAVLECVLILAEYFLGYRLGSIFYLLRIVVFTGFISWISYHVIKLLFPVLIYTTKPVTPKSNTISAKEIAAFKVAIKKLMGEDKIYLNPDLNVNILASYIGTTQKKCSQIIRTEYDTNFNAFINSFRIEEFKRKIDAGQHKDFTLLSIAFESGFESKSTFNRSFKQVIGLSPSQYIKSLKNG